MFKLKNGSLRTVIYNANDLELYKQAGWSLVEEPKKKKEKNKENSEDEQDNTKGESNEE